MVAVKKAKSPKIGGDPLDHILEGCQIISHDFRYLYVNDAVVKQAKSTKASLMGRTMMEKYPGIEKSPMFAELSACMAKKKPHKMENLFTFPDGSVAWFELRIEPLPEGAIILSLDITERKEATLAMEKSKAMLDTVLENLPVGVFVAKVPGGEPLLINKIGIEILGRGLIPGTPKEKNAEVYEFIREDGSIYPPEELPLYKTLKTSQSVYADDLYSRRPDGKTIALRGITAPLKDPAGKLQSALAVFEDITNRKLLEKSEKEFVVLASHHLRTPLNIIKNSTELIADGDLGKVPKAVDKFVREALVAVTQAIDLVGKLLNIARAEAGSLAVSPEPINAEAVVKEALSDWQKAIKAKALKVSFKAEKLKTIEGDRNLIKSICSSLISNGVLYTEKHGAIDIHLSKKGKMMVLRIRDTGLGIPKAEQERVFTRFYRASNIESLGPLGHGLSLFLTKKIVAILGGTISFTSQENKGSEFTLELPAKNRLHRLGEPYSQTIN